MKSLSFLMICLVASDVLAAAGSAVAESKQVDSVCDRPTLCVSRQAFRRWLRNRPGARDLLIRKGQCFSEPETWRLVASDESPWDPIAKWTMKRPGQSNAVVWTGCHIGDPADY